jgi:thymidine phosphorylase
MEVTYALAREMVLMGGRVEQGDAAQRMVEDAIGSGRALELFVKMVEGQGGDPRIVDDYSLLALAKHVEEIKAECAGYITDINAYEVGLVTLALGGGRKKKEDTIDPGVGIVLKRRTGAWVEKGEGIATVYFSNAFAEDIKKRFISAITIEETPPPIPSMIVAKM